MFDILDASTVHRIDMARLNHQQAILGFCPRGNFYATLSDQLTVRMYDATSGQQQTAWDLRAKANIAEVAVNVLMDRATSIPVPMGFWSGSGAYIAGLAVYTQHSHYCKAYVVHIV